jgi:hypothetical protein
MVAFKVFQISLTKIFRPVKCPESSPLCFRRPETQGMSILVFDVILFTGEVNQIKPK